MDGEIVVVWQGKVKGNDVVFGRVQTSVPNVLQALDRVSLSPEEFNSMVSGVGTSQFLPCTLFVKGSKFGQVFSVLKSEGLCSEFRSR
jgi:hypothetical protein